jgi:uncharacterized tellurite resistance protein B-like protein
MFDALKKLFSRQVTQTGPMEPRLAVAAILVHLAAIDGDTSEREQGLLRGALKTHYGLDDATVDRLIDDARVRDQDSVDFYGFTSTLSALDSAEKLTIIRMMWTVVFADRQNHELEDNMVWRIAELIGVPARERMLLRAEVAKA